MKRILIVGAGLSGCTIAERLANYGGFDIDIIEKRNHIGGNCYDYKDDNGILVNKYGPHLFHTSSEKVWEYIQLFSIWVPWKHKVLGNINGVLFPVPVNIDTVNILCGTSIQNEYEMTQWLNSNSINIKNPSNSEEVALNKVGYNLYELIFKHYTYKQWNKYPSDLDASVLQRIPVRINHDPYYFSDTYQALPKDGYTQFISTMIQHPSIHLYLNKEFTHDMKELYDYIFYTGPIDKYYESYKLPKLEYRSLRFEYISLDMDYFQPTSQVNYTSSTEPFTRIVEYKHFLNQPIQGKTTIVKEYSSSEGEPYYPVPNQDNQNIYKMYQELATKEKSVYFVGRLATYKYYNMDQAILAALNLVEEFYNNNYGS